MSQADSQLPRGALYVALGQGAFVLTGYLLHILLSRWLTAADFGLFNVTMAVLVWTEITVNNGVPVALQRFLPDRGLSESSVLDATARCQAMVAVAVFVFMFLATPLLALLLRDPALTGYLRLALIDVLAMAAYAYYRGALNGWRSFRQLSATIGAYSVAKLAAISGLVLLGLGIRGALIGNVISSLGGLTAGYLWTRRRRRAADLTGSGLAAAPAAVPPESPAAVSVRGVMAFVLPAALFTLASNVLLGLDLMGVKALVSDADQVGYYSAAVKLAEAPRLVLLAFSFTLLPSLSHAIAAADLDRTRHYLQQTMRLLNLVLLPILALVSATAEGVILLTFPDSYRSAGPILGVLVFAYAAYTVYITLVTALLAENRPGRALAIPLALLPMAAAAVWAGVTYLGLPGAALASLLVTIAAALVVAAYVFYRFRPAAGPLLRSLARVGLASAAIWGLARLWSPGGLVLIPAYLLLGGLYLALLFLLGELRRQDLDELRSLIPRPRRKGGM
ncbi:MAG: lipopolysaccharide biosynthesis protein [Anaerolineae bacterium]